MLAAMETILVLDLAVGELSWLEEYGLPSLGVSWEPLISPIPTWIPYKCQLIEFPDSTCMLLGTKLKMRYIFSISEFRAVTVIHYRSEGWTHWFMQLDSCESFNRRASYVDIVAYNLDQGNQRKFKYTLECSRGIGESTEHFGAGLVFTLCTFPRWARSNCDMEARECSKAVGWQSWEALWRRQGMWREEEQMVYSLKERKKNCLINTNLICRY